MRFGGRTVRPVPRYACYGSNLSRRNCGTDRRALPYLPSSLPSQNWLERNRCWARTERLRSGC